MRFTTALAAAIVLAGWSAGQTAENLVPHSDIEAGKVGNSMRGWSTQAEGGGEGRVAVTDATAHSGRLSWQIDNANGKGFVHPNVSVTVTRGQYVLSFWARGEKDIEFTANLYWAADKWQTLVSKQLTAKAGAWQRYEIPATFLEDFPGSIQIGLRTAGRMWLDDVELIKTGSRASRAVAVETAAAGGWTKLAEGAGVGQSAQRIRLTNDKLSVTVGGARGAAELRPAGSEGSATATVVALSAAGEPMGTLGKLELIEFGRAGAAVRAAGKSAKGAAMAVEFRLGRGQTFIETRAAAGVERVRVEASCRFVVLPDFFTDDVVLDARSLPADRAEAPSDNFLMQMSGAGSAFVLNVAEKGEREMELSLAGAGEARRVVAAEIHCDGGKVWTAVVAAEGAWHERDVKAAEAGKVIELAWKAPWPAGWRADFGRPNGIVDSWEMIVEAADGRFAKPGWMGVGGGTIPADRKRWTTVLNTFYYPCWIARDGRGLIQPIDSRVLRFEGPAVIYPICRTEQTPLDAFTVMDVVRESLGVGPCEYVMDLAGQRSQYRGMATCATRDTLMPIYKAGQQRAKRAEVDKTLDAVLLFIRHIRGRIEGYVQFGHELRAWLAEQKKARPELADLIDELDRTAAELDARVADRAESIRTPAYAADLVAKFRADGLEAEGADGVARCKALTEALVRIGSNQDHLVGECRWVVRAVRQRAGIAMAADPRAADLAREVRDRTHKALRSPASHEAARH